MKSADLKSLAVLPAVVTGGFTPDMTTWENVLESAKLFLSTALQSGVPFRQFLSVLFALIYAAVPMLDNITIPIDKLIAKPFAAPAIMSEYSYEEGGLVDDADFYVSPDGDDTADGSFSHPFKTITAARDAVRVLDKSGKTGVTVAIKAGEYRTGCVDFGAEDGSETCPVTYTAYGDGEVVLNGGLKIPSSAFSKITDGAVLDRLSADAKKNALVADLFSLGVTAEDYGKIYAIGAYNTAWAYSGDYTGPVYSGLFVNEERCSLARYPDTGFIKTGKVVSEGGAETPDGPEGDTYAPDRKTAKRVGSWKTLDDVWMMGFWRYDWADGSTPVASFDKEKGELKTKFYSRYGTKDNAPFFFFNVLEELDSPNEWYLDRENGKLYFYPPADIEKCSVEMSLSTQPVIRVSGTNGINFKGLTVSNTRSDAVIINGENITVEHCKVKNTGGSAIVADGRNITVRDCDIRNTGRGGIYLSGGDTPTLTPSGNIAVNNLICHISEIYLTYQPGISLYGVGNRAEHNEIFDSPHEAVTYGGNDNIIAYNRIHEVCKITSDAGAIYAGRSWCSYGNKVLYNCIYNLGTGDFTPCGIYLDDALSGQTVEGNLLVNIPGVAIMLGGGRDLVVRNNIVVARGDKGLQYDQRAIDGFFGGWFEEHSGKDGNMWTDLRSSPWKTETWQKAYPGMAKISDDMNDPDNPYFAANPANSRVDDNLYVTGRRTVGAVDEKVLKYSEFSGNALFSPAQLGLLFVDAGNGDYRLRDDSPATAFSKDIRSLPIEQMGRVNG